MSAPHSISDLAHDLPVPAPVLTRRGWSVFWMAVVAIAVLAPLANLVIPEGQPLHLSGYMVGLLGKIMCYAICALAIDLIWGYTGILSLGHGLFFALGGYVMGMYLMRQIGLDGNYKSPLPDFMIFLDWKELPWHWALSDSLPATLALIVLVPAVVAYILCVSFAHQRCVFLNHHAGFDLCCAVAVLSQRNRFGRQQRLY